MKIKLKPIFAVLALVSTCTGTAPVFADIDTLKEHQQITNEYKKELK